MLAVDTVTVKGSPIRSLVHLLERELTEAQREEVLAAIPPEYAARFREQRLAPDPVPFDVLNRLTRAAAEVRGESLEDFGRRAGREAASEAIHGLYRFFAMVMTAHALLAKAPSMWQALYNRGEVRIADETEHSATIQLVDFPSDPAACARMTGWIERMAELTGTTNVEVTHPHCVNSGAAMCEWFAYWK